MCRYFVIFYAYYPILIKTNPSVSTVKNIGQMKCVFKKIY